MLLNDICLNDLVKIKSTAISNGVNNSFRALERYAPIGSMNFAPGEMFKLALIRSHVDRGDRWLINLANDLDGYDDYNKAMDLIESKGDAKPSGPLNTVLPKGYYNTELFQVATVEDLYRAVDLFAGLVLTEQLAEASWKG